jgi:hypothetical protein
MVRVMIILDDGASKDTIVGFLKQYAFHENEIIRSTLKLDSAIEQFINGHLITNTLIENVDDILEISDKIAAASNYLLNHDRIIIDIKEDAVSLTKGLYNKSIAYRLTDALITWKYGGPISPIVEASNSLFNGLYNLKHSVGLLDEFSTFNSKSIDELIIESVVSIGNIALRPATFTTHSKKHNDVFKKKNKDHWYLQFSI